MNHREFVEAYRAGAVRVEIDPKTAARFLSRRLLLPFVMLPVLGLGTALALVGWVWSGFALIGAATVAAMLIKRSAPHFVLTQCLEDERFYEDATNAGVLKLVIPDAPQAHVIRNPFIGG